MGDHAGILGAVVLFYFNNFFTFLPVRYSGHLVSHLTVFYQNITKQAQVPILWKGGVQWGTYFKSLSKLTCQTLESDFGGKSQKKGGVAVGFQKGGMENPREEETWRLLVTQQKSPSPLGFHPFEEVGEGGGRRREDGGVG